MPHIQVSQGKGVLSNMPKQVSINGYLTCFYIMLLTNHEHDQRNKI